MKNSRLKHKVRDEVRKACKLVQLFQDKQKPESIHHLRISLKKIKAVCTLTRIITGKDPGSKLLRPLFRTSGSLRDIQVYRELLSSLRRRPARLLERLEMEEETLSHRFRKRSPVHLSALRAFERQLSVPLHARHFGKIQQYFQKQNKKATRELAAPDRRTMHRCRKKIKRMLYILDMLPAKWKKQMPVDRELLNLLQEKAGRWHDTYAVIRFAQRRHLTPRQFPASRLQTLEKQQFRAIHRKFTGSGKKSEHMNTFK